MPLVTCAGKHGHNPQILDCPRCVEEERDRYREALKSLRKSFDLVNHYATYTVSRGSWIALIDHTLGE